MERAEVMTALRSGEQATFPQEFEDRVPENAKRVRQASMVRDIIVYILWQSIDNTGCGILSV